MARVELSAGHWADLRDARDLRAGDKMDLIAEVRSESGGENIVALSNALLRKLIVGWQVWDEGGTPLALPRDMPDTLRLLSIDDYDALTAAARPAMELLFPQKVATDAAGLKEQVADPASPTGSAAV